MTCPSCGSDSGRKAIYMALPVKFCERCSTIWGFWSFVPCIWFNGVLFFYEGPYWKALRHWMFDL